MRGWRLRAGLVLAALPSLVGAGGSARAAAGVAAGGGVRAELSEPRPHDLHIAYADMAVEGALIAGRIRFFKDDLERALGTRTGDDAFALTPGASSDALVLQYLTDRLRISAHGGVLEAQLLASGADELDREPVWWVTVQYRSPAPVESLQVENTLLLEHFDDQRNVMKFVRFPERTERTYAFEYGDSRHHVRF